MNQYDLFCSQVCDVLGWKFQKTDNGVIVLDNGGLITLSDCAIKLLGKVKNLQEEVGELKVDNNKFKETIKQYRLDQAKKKVG